MAYEERTARESAKLELSPDMKTMSLRRLPGKVRAISLCPPASVAWIDETGTLTLQDFDGQRLLEMDSPEEPFDDCFCDEDGPYLWTGAPSKSKHVAVQLYNRSTGAIIDECLVEDHFGGSSCLFHATGKAGLLSLWLAAGNPDMVQVFWLKRTRSGITCRREVRLRNTIPPVFSPTGAEFLVLNELQSISKYDFATMEQVGSPLLPDDEDNPFAESLCYLNDILALASTNEQRIFVVNTVKMRIEGEAVLEGHEPRAIGEYYPNLAKESGLATDISHFARLGDAIVFVYRRDQRGPGVADWEDSLLWLWAKKRG